MINLQDFDKNVHEKMQSCNTAIKHFFPLSYQLLSPHWDKYCKGNVEIVCLAVLPISPAPVVALQPVGEGRLPPTLETTMSKAHHLAYSKWLWTFFFWIICLISHIYVTWNYLVISSVHWYLKKFLKMLLIFQV